MNPFRFPITSLLGPNSFLSFEPMNLIIEPSENCGGLYLGNYEAASDVSLLKKHGIRAVLTVAADLKLIYPEGFFHEKISALDMVSYDLSKHFSRCFDFIDKYRAETNVLVHCLAGISRSATIVIAYLMRMNKSGFDQCFSFVKKRRKIIYPNPGFIRQLKIFSSQINGKNVGIIDKNRSQSKAKFDESQNNLRSLSLTTLHKKQQEPINFKTPQKSYNYFNVNFNSNALEKNKTVVKPMVANAPIIRNPNDYIKNPYMQNLSKSNKKESTTNKLTGKFMTPATTKSKIPEYSNFLILKSKKI